MFQLLYVEQVPSQLKTRRQGKTMALRKRDFDEHHEQPPQEEQAQLTIGVDPALLRRIEKVASEHGLSIDDYLRQILDLVIPKEARIVQRPRHIVPDDIMEQVYRVQEQVIRESKGHLFEDSAEALRRDREERTRYLEQLREQ
jgi:predicted DNA binding CopG/RHH family protein